MEHPTQFEQACDLIAQGRPQDALYILNNISNPSAEILSKIGTSYMMLGRQHEGKNAYRQAVEANQKYVPALANYALVLAEEGDHLTALVYAKKAYDLDPENIPLHSTYAMILRYLGENKAAADILKSACKLVPNGHEITVNLAGILSEMGVVEEARIILEYALLHNPFNPRAHLMLASIKTFKEDDPQIVVMERIVKDQNAPNETKIEIYYALGKAYEDCKLYDQSFGNYENGNDLYRNSYDYESHHDQEFFKTLKQENFRAVNTEDNLQPIFIIGMPRSSTSLVEQILSTYDNIVAMGELNLIELLFHKVKNDECFNLEMARDYYLKTISKRLKDQTIFIDKMPMNFRFVPFIKSIFPNSKFIHCQRDAIDICFSMYKKKFAGHIPFAQNLSELTQYYCLYEDMMIYWKHKYTDDILDISYSNLVESTEIETKKITDFLNLSWTEDILQFHTSKRPVITASHAQVRKPIYNDGLAYWKNYEEHLSDLMILKERH